MINKFKEFIEGYEVMAELTYGIRVELEYFHTKEDFNYLKVYLGNIFSFELFCYVDKIVMSIYLLTYEKKHKKLQACLDSLNLQISHQNQDSTIKSARYTFQDFNDFIKVFFKMTEIVKND